MLFVQLNKSKTYTAIMIMFSSFAIILVILINNGEYAHWYTKENDQQGCNSAKVPLQ